MLIKYFISKESQGQEGKNILIVCLQSGVCESFLSIKARSPDSRIYEISLTQLLLLVLFFDLNLRNERWIVPFHQSWEMVCGKKLRDLSRLFIKYLHCQMLYSEISTYEGFWLALNIGLRQIFVLLQLPVSRRSIEKGLRCQSISKQALQVQGVT